MKNTFEELMWLQQLQKDLMLDREMETVQADPIYYGIVDYKEQVVAEGYEDKIIIYDSRTNEKYELQTFFDNLSADKQALLADDIDSGISTSEDGTFYISSDNDFANYITTYINDSKKFADCIMGQSNLQLHYVAETEYVCTDCLFLTRSAAEKHLEENRHHYSKKAKTYAMTAWRSPQYEHLLELLKAVDWEHSNIVFKNMKYQLNMFLIFDTEICKAENTMPKEILDRFTHHIEEFVDMDSYPEISNIWNVTWAAISEPANKVYNLSMTLEFDKKICEAKNITPEDILNRISHHAEEFVDTDSYPELYEIRNINFAATE